MPCARGSGIDMLKPLNVVLTETKDKTPLAVIPNLLHEEFSPQQLRAVAATLNKIADDCEARPIDPKYWTRSKVVYEFDLKY